MTDQANREKVIKGLVAVKETLEDMRDKLGAKWCEDAIALLKAQGEVEPTWRLGVPFCSKCGRQFKRGYKYCPDCGQAVKWE